MKGLTIALALAVIAPLNVAVAQDYTSWPGSDVSKCLMERGDTTVAKLAATDANCGPVGDPSRAGRGYVLADEFEDLIRSIRLGDANGTQQMMRGFYRTTNISPAMNSCWKTKVAACNAQSIGAAVEAAKPQ